MTRLTLLPIGFCAIVLTATVSVASVITVRQDGSGDYMTITDGVAAASVNDTISVGPGTYVDQIHTTVALSFISTHGPTSTVIDGEGLRYHLWFTGTTDCEVKGFKFINGYHTSGGGSIRVQAGARVTIGDCVFENNQTDFFGGAVIVRDTGSRAEISNSSFTGNSSVHNGGAITAVLNSELVVNNCTFTQNSTGVFGGAIATNDNSTLEVVGCLFDGNTSGDESGALYVEDTSGLIVSNTFHANASPGGSGTARLQNSSGVSVTRNIFSGDTAGYGLYYYGLPGVHSCNVFWNNAQGSIENATLAFDEVEADPVFCNLATGDFTISTNSPAAAANSQCGLVVGAFPTACDIEPPPPPVVEPVILSILDVPNDPGRQVRIKWERSVFDGPDPQFTITGYAIYRFQGQFAAEFGSAPPPTWTSAPPINLIEGWDFIVTVPARGDSIYQFVAPTLCDSTVLNGICWSVFFVSAMTPDPLVFFDSAPDSGYSVDNLPPFGPPSFSVSYNTAQGNELTWDAPQDAGLDHYRVYRETDPYFLPGPQNLVQTTEETQWMDPIPNGGNYHYRLTAVDEGGNESDEMPPETVTGLRGRMEAPDRFALYQNAPNPFNPTTRVQYDVPIGGGEVTLHIFDVSGSLIRTLVNGNPSAGSKTVLWYGRDDHGQPVASGVYFYRLRGRGFTQTRKMVLVR